MVSGLPRVPHPDFARFIVHRFTLLFLILVVAANVFSHSYVNRQGGTKKEGVYRTLKQHYAVMN
jgi:hypothetical protein